ncbi:hypothetical protein GMA7_63 [Gordonia phage GMA7]|uniref:Uncharacterized protein n=1 Tax=Gordonia phage GMA7 TaxID=1647286 RepID=A0A0K0N6P7_9CAUD|nr:hypothetical protein AU104_gp055 [Gordonia phage GMA7]AKJ72500.1 hypothetical protein GMA7_63 [Gordonia phage GMA7]
MTYASWPEIFPTANQPDHESHLDWTYACGDPHCVWTTYHKTKSGAESERERHHENDLCPYTETRMLLADGGGFMPVGPSIIEKYWLELDRVTKALMDQRPRFKNDEMSPEELEGYFKLQGQAQGIAIALQIISEPHFEDVTAVSKWSLKRYRMSKGEIDFMPTPGVQGHNPMPEPTKVQPKATRKSSPIKRGPKADPKTGKFRAMSNEDREHLKGMIEQGLPDAVIQGMLKISEEQFETEKSKL